MFLKDEDCVRNEYYAYNCLFFKLIGLCKFQKQSKQLIYVCFLNLTVACALFGQITTLFNSELEINYITKVLETTLPTLCFGFCYYNLLLNSTVMGKILNRINCDWDELENKPEFVILKDYAHVSRRCSITIALIFYFYVGFLMSPSLFRTIQYIIGVKSETELILPVPVDIAMKNRILFYLALLIEYINMAMITMIGIANYTMFITIIQHACALFNIISAKIDGRFNTNNEKFDNFTVHGKIVDENEWIIDIIEFYNNVVDFITLIKLCYERVFIYEVSLASLMIIVDYYYLLEVLSITLNTGEAIKKFSYIIGSLSVIFAYHYLGQKLIDNHDKVYTKLCQIPFYTLTLKTQKMLLFLTMRSIKPCNLSIKGVIVISHYLFASLMQTSFSYAMIFRNLQ